MTILKAAIGLSAVLAASACNAQPQPSSTDNQSAAVSAVAVAAQSSSAAAVEQPEGWGVQYQNATCVVMTDASGVGDEPPYLIKMGNMQGNQLLFIFSVANDAYKEIEIQEGTESMFIVDGKQFESLGIRNVDGELILMIENSLNLQRSLTEAKSVGLKIKFPHMDHFIDAAGFDLHNISGAISWLDACNLLGVGALPR